MMRMITPRIYLAGPGVFRPDAKLYGDLLKSIATGYGLEGLYPLDNDTTAEAGNDAAVASVIYYLNKQLMARAHAIVADISPFRGPNMDPGTAMEIGFFDARGLPIFCYSRDLATLLNRTIRLGYSKPRDAMHDARGNLIENFGLVENLMIAIPAGKIFASATEAIAAAARTLGAEVRKAG